VYSFTSVMAVRIALVVEYAHPHELGTAAINLVSVLVYVKRTVPSK
jgi:hypothetical protein